MPTAQERIFRSSALARHTSPEGLDTLLEITTVKGWIALIGLAAVIVGALIWGVLGRIPQVVPGQGIMVAEGQPFVTTAWWITLFPGISIVVLAFAFSLLGDALGDMLGVHE